MRSDANCKLSVIFDDDRAAIVRLVAVKLPQILLRKMPISNVYAWQSPFQWDVP
jgi:hypothetical protein